MPTIKRKMKVKASRSTGSSVPSSKVAQSSGVSDNCSSTQTSFDADADLVGVCATIAEVTEAFSKSKNDAKAGRGMPFLDAKNQLLLSYLDNLASYLENKSSSPFAAAASSTSPNSATSSDAEHVFRELYKIRLAFGRAKSLDQKLQYSIQKLLDEAAAAESGDTAKTAKTSAKPSLSLAKGSILLEDQSENPVGSGGGQDETADYHAGGTDASSKDGIYRPPKITAMECGYDSAVSKAEKQLQREEKRLRNTQIYESLQDIVNDCSSGAVEVLGDTSSGRSNEVEKLLRKQRERAAYEEDNLMRMRQTKQDKKDAKRLKQLRTQGGGGQGAVSLRDLNSAVDIIASSTDKLNSYQKAKSRVGEIAGAKKEMMAAQAASKKSRSGGASGKGSKKGSGKKRK
ncbi:unnamed protein product [Amoebophrya sp. A25]|nr:unnamed protein product [Amoebophrya sp. A25]|eukprot:GSA25T00016523001.1